MRSARRQSSDRLIFERKDMPNWFVNGGVSEDGRYLFITFSQGTDPKNRLYFADLGDPKRSEHHGSGRRAHREGRRLLCAGRVGRVDPLRRNRPHAPRRRVVSFDLRNRGGPPGLPSCRKVRTQSKASRSRMARSPCSTWWTCRASSSSSALDGKDLGTVALPGIGTVEGLSGRNDSPELFYAFTSPFIRRPSSSMSGPVRRPAPFEAARPAFDPAGYETKQFFAASKDGTRVPYFVTARRNLALNGSQPDAALRLWRVQHLAHAGLSLGRAAWLERGGVFVTASLRGGSEYGEEWHQAGMLEKKQNVFDDFIAVAEDLIDEGTPRRRSSRSRAAPTAGCWWGGGEPAARPVRRWRSPPSA